MGSDAINTGYARAILELAQAENVVDRVEEELLRLRDLLRSNGTLLEFLRDPNIQREGKRQALAELFEGRVEPVVLGVLMTMSDQDRIHRVLPVIDEYRVLAARARERVTGELTTAVTLDEPTVSRIEQELSRITGKNVRLVQKVDSSVLGGAVIKIGERIIDGSLRRKLEQVREQLARP